MKPTTEFAIPSQLFVIDEHDKIAVHRFADGVTNPSRAVLCIPGYAASAESFARLHPLAGEFDLRLLTVTGTTEIGNAVEEQSETIAFLARRFDHPVILGTSFGGLVALRTAARLHRRISALILISTFATIDSAAIRLAERSGVLGAMEWLGALEPSAALRIVDGERLDDNAAAELHRESQQLGYHEKHARLHAALLADLRGAASRIRVPTLILHGDADRVVPMSAANDLASHIPHAQFRVIKGAGHVPYLTHPAEVNGMLASFLREVLPDRYHKPE
jgi:pimeloyl-ACP methyl ester carboxylesterase